MIFPVKVRFGAIFISLAASFISLTQAAPCLEESPVYGVDIKNNPKSYEEYFVVDDDDMTRVTQFRYCKCCIDSKGDENFKGFEATIYSPTSGYYTQQFGVMDGTDQNTVCETHDMGIEELMYLQVFANSKHITGVIWTGDQGTEWVFQTVSSTSGSPIEQMQGRPIGFRVWIGDGGENKDVPMSISVVYNSCSCPGSTFTGQQPFQDMTIDAIIGTPQTQTLQYQTNYIESVYGQDCGGYTIDYYPQLTFLTFSQSGVNLDPRGQPYIDLGTLTAGSGDDVGQYQVTLVTYQDITNSNHGFETPYRGVFPQQEQEFTITVNPCPSTQLASTQAMPDIYYQLGDPPVTLGSYAFEDGPNQCGWAQTISFSGGSIVAFMTHDEINKEFTVKQTFDESLIGENIVTIEAKIQVYTDYTKTTYQEQSITQTFSVFVDPCQVDSLTLNPNNNVLYTIGDVGGALSDAYSFAQSPECYYTPTIIITGELSFFQHRPGDKTFEVFETQDLTLEGIYEVTVRAEISFWSDYSKLSQITVFEEFTFSIEMVNPCYNAVLNPLTITDMTQQVSYPDISQVVIGSADSISLSLGDLSGLTYCGNRVIEITTDPTQYQSFLSFDSVSNTITVGTTDVNDIGSHTIDALIYLQDYPAVQTTSSFTVLIIHCQVTDMEQTLLPKQFYSVHSSAITFQAEFFTITPTACGYILDYLIRLFDPLTATYQPLPAWLSNSVDLQFSVQSSDTSIVGDYQISIIGSVPSEFMDPTYSEELLIDLNVALDCSNDDVSALSTIANQLYYIDVDGSRDFYPTWDNTIPGCPATYSVKRIDGGVERSLIPSEEAVLVFNSIDGSVSLATSDFALDGELWTIRIYKDSTLSSGPNRIGEYIFDIDFRDICWDSDLVPAQFTQLEYVYDRWEFESLIFTEMVDNSLGSGYCGGYYSLLEYVSGPALSPGQDPATVDLTHYSSVPLSGGLTIALQGVVDMPEWEGVHYLQIRSSLGSFDPTVGSRGENGLYNTVYSDPVKLTIIDPCSRSQVNQIEPLITEMTVPDGKTSLLKVLSGPTNSISVQYGNGYDKCGPLIYKFRDFEGNTFEFDLFKESLDAVTDEADVLKWKLESESTGSVRVNSFTLEVSLRNYLTSTPAKFDINLYYRECFPTDFSGDEIEDIEVTVGDKPFSIDFHFNQSPCIYDQEYFVEVNDNKTGETAAISTFIILGEQAVYFNSPTARDIGDFEVKVCSKITNFLETTSCTSFDIRVKPAPQNKVWTVEPDFMLNLKDKEVKVGSSLVYTLDDPIGAYGYKMDVSMRLQRASRFATYDKELNSFKVNGDQVTSEDIGLYPIEVSATFFNETISESYSKFFILEIWDENEKASEEKTEKWFPPNPIFFPDWPGHRFVRKNYTQEQDPERPIPYIQDIDQDGIVKIGWNKFMSPPVNQTEIPPTLIAVEDELELEEYRFWETRGRQLQSYEKFVPQRQQNLNIVYFADENEQTYELVKLVDALEVLITPGDPDNSQPIEFSWAVIGFDKQHIQIKLEIKNPRDISTDQNYDTLSVTFWGVEFFKSRQGKEVLFGTTLYQPLHRQIDQADKDAVDLINGFAFAFVLIACVFMIPVVSVGSLLPAWMFINSFQIIAHMPLLKTILPANVHYFLKEYLDILRLYDSDFIKQLDETYNLKTYAIGKGAYNALLEACDYNVLYAQNMVIILIILGISLIILVACIIKDSLFACGKCSCWQSTRLGKRKFGVKVAEQKHAPRCSNFTLRFVYELFLEFCIVVFLQLSVVDFTTFSSKFQFVLAIITVCGVALLLAFVGLLIFKMGPWVPDFYSEGTALASVSQVRGRNKNFSKKKWLKDHPIPALKPWGASIINFDLETFIKSCFCCCKRTTVSDVKKDTEEIPQTEQKLVNTLVFTRQDEIKEDELDDKAISEQPIAKQPIEEELVVTKPIAEQQFVERPITQQPRFEKWNRNLHNSFLNDNIQGTQEYEGGEPCRDDSEYANSRISSLHPSMPLRMSPNRDHDSSGLSSCNSDVIAAKKGSFKANELQRKSLSERSHKQARLRLLFESTVQPAQSFKTLHFGLKLNHERNVAVIHPLMFLVRRVIYALVIVFMGETMYFGVLIALLSCFVMLAYVLHEQQWQDCLINWQHIVNECFIYISCLFLLMFSLVDQTGTRYFLGYLLIGSILIFVVFNTVIIIYSSARLISLYVMRLFVLFHGKKIQKEAFMKTQKIDKEFKDCFVPGRQEEHTFAVKLTATWGVSAVLEKKKTKIKKADSFEEQSEKSVSKDFFCPDILEESEKQKKELLLKHVDSQALKEDNVFEKRAPTKLMSIGLKDYLQNLQDDKVPKLLNSDQVRVSDFSMKMKSKDLVDVADKIRVAEQQTFEKFGLEKLVVNNVLLPGKTLSQQASVYDSVPNESVQATMDRRQPSSKRGEQTIPTQSAMKSEYRWQSMSQEQTISVNNFPNNLQGLKSLELSHAGSSLGGQSSLKESFKVAQESFKTKNLDVSLDDILQRNLESSRVKRGQVHRLKSADTQEGFSHQEQVNTGERKMTMFKVLKPVQSLSNNFSSFSLNTDKPGSVSQLGFASRDGAVTVQKEIIQRPEKGLPIISRLIQQREARNQSVNFHRAQNQINSFEQRSLHGNSSTSTAKGMGRTFDLDGLNRSGEPRTSTIGRLEQNMITPQKNLIMTQCNINEPSFRTQRRQMPQTEKGSYRQSPLKKLFKFQIDTDERIQRSNQNQERAAVRPALNFNQPSRLAEQHHKPFRQRVDVITLDSMSSRHSESDAASISVERVFKRGVRDKNNPFKENPNLRRLDHLFDKVSPPPLINIQESLRNERTIEPNRSVKYSSKESSFELAEGYFAQGSNQNNRYNQNFQRLGKQLMPNAGFQGRLARKTGPLSLELRPVRQPKAIDQLGQRSDIEPARHPRQFYPESK